MALTWTILIGLSVLLYYPQIKTPVQGRHAWAMADHFAISLNFLENSFDFFHPETYCLNPQFAATNAPQIKNDAWYSSPKTPQGITSIDPPMHHYVVALLMKTFQTKNPIVYRFYMLLLSLIGLFYLFKLSYLVTQSFWITTAMSIFVMLAPTFTYYAVGFLPSSAALAFLFISAFHITRFHFEKQNKNLYYSLVFMTLAALTRFPFIIYLIGLLSTYLLIGLLDKKIYWKKMLLLVACLVIVLSYFMYNKFYLSAYFGSNFLSHPLPVTSLHEFINAIWKTLYHESWRYFTLIHYFCLFFVGFLFLKKRKQQLSFKQKNFLFYYLSIVSIGVFCYSFLMLQQFVAHDYYILDTFFPILLFWLLAFLKQVDLKHLTNVKKYLVIFTILAFGLNRLVFKMGYDARPTTPLEITRTNFIDSHKILDSLQIAKKAKILLIDSYSPNLAFIGLQRKGFCLMRPTKKRILRAMTWEFDYIITQNFSYKEKVLKNYPTFENETEIYFSNDKFTIHRKK